MMQTRTQSLVESLTQVAVGYLVALATQIAVFPLLGIPVTLGQNLQIGLVFTAVSIVRSYALRRVFARIHGR